METQTDPLSRYPDIVRTLLTARNITTPEEVEAFLNPDFDKHIHDPFLMKGMEKSVERILKGISENEKIVIYGDYDCDGIPGSTVLHDFFKKIGYANFKNYIPHRHSEGYGLNIPAIEKLWDEGYTLMITVDSGIADVEPVARANELGMTVIITDHHLPIRKEEKDFLPPAYAILNSKQEDDPYPYKMLCGSGVAWKLVCALLARGKFDIPVGWEKWLLDVVGIATVADMVPLDGENRVLARYGLMVLRKTRRPGLLALFNKMRMNPRHLTEDDIGFMIAPRINAASRMDEPMLAFELLATKDDVRATALAAQLDKLNNTRKGVVAGLAKEIKKRLGERLELREVIVLGDPSWKPALLGLAANSVVEELKRPVFLWGVEGDGGLKGSCRSDGSVDVVELMAASGVFIESGGHALAGGFALSKENVHQLEDSLIATYAKVKNDKGVVDTPPADLLLSIDQVTPRTHETLALLAPYGIGNPKPVCSFESVVVSKIVQFGKREEHLKLECRSNGRMLPAIAFFTQAERFPSLREGATITLLAYLEKSFFNNAAELRLRIVDIV